MSNQTRTTKAPAKRCAKWKPRKTNAARAAEALRRRGAFQVAA